MRRGFGNAAMRQSTLLAGIVLWRLTTRPQHADLLPLSLQDIVGFAAAAFALLVAAGGGIGGGALLVPICLIILGAQSCMSVNLALFRVWQAAGTCWHDHFRGTSNL